MKRFKAVVIILFLLLLQSLFACGRGSGISIFDDYDDFLKNLTQYYLPETEENLAEIKGYKPLIKKSFDYAQNFSGSYAFVKTNDKNLIMDSNGSLYEIKDDLSNNILLNDAYIYETRNLYGLKLLNGEVLLPAKYEEITYKGNTILAREKNFADIYVNKTFFNKINYKSNIVLINESTLIFEGFYYDLTLNMLKYLDCNIIDTPSNGMIIISKDNLFGYVSSDFNAYIEPIYNVAYRFSNGYASVEKDDKYILLNKQGNIVFQSDEIRLNSFVNGYFCFGMKNFCGIMNENFEIVKTPIFNKIQDNRVYGNYVLNILNDQTKVYDLQSEKYYDSTFKSVNPYNSEGSLLFICTNQDNTKSIFDERFNLLADNYDSISIYNNIIMLEKEQKFYFYRSE